MTFKGLCISSALAMCCLPALAASLSAEFDDAGECGSATVISGTTCSNVQVKLSFAGCDLKSEAVTVGKVICDKTTIKARHQDGNFRYEARFQKVDDGWGGVTWKALGGVKQFKRKGTEAVALAVPAPAAPAVVAVPAPAPAERSVASDVVAAIKVSGFFDFRNSTVNVPGASTTNENEKSGYVLEDGALYFKYAKDRIEALVDLPFHRNSATGTNDAHFAFAMTKAQAVIAYSINDKFKISAGQFDTIYGFELNDSKDRLFGNAGLVYGQTLPIVHSGVYAQFSQNGFTAKLLSANPADRDSLGTTANDSNLETGATVGYANSFIRGQLGYLTRPQTALDGSTSDRSLTDVLLGFTIGPVDIDGQFSIVKNPQKNSLTANATDAEDAGQGLLVVVAYKITDELKLGARYESLDKDPGASNYYKAQTLGGVAHYLVNENLTARLEWNDIQTDRREGSTTDLYGESRLDIGAVVSF